MVDGFPVELANPADGSGTPAAIRPSSHGGNGPAVRANSLRSDAEQTRRNELV
jgi:hypothetical protein